MTDRPSNHERLEWTEMDVAPRRPLAPNRPHWILLYLPHAADRHASGVRIGCWLDATEDRRQGWFDAARNPLVRPSRWMPFPEGPASGSEPIHPLGSEAPPRPSFR